MMRRLCLVFAALISAGGCMMTGDGERMRADLKALEQRVEAGDRDLRQASKEAKEQVKTLREVMEQATRLLERNTADAGLQISRTQTDLTSLQGRVDELAHMLAKLQQAVSQAGPASARQTPMPTTADETWTEASKLLAANEFEDARRFLRGFIETYRSDRRRAQAQLLLGESYYRQSKHAAAIGEYQKVIDRHPRSPLLEDAMYKIGLCFFELRYCSDARTFLSETLKRYPRSRKKRSIRAKLGEIERNRRNRRVCAS